VAAFGDQVHYIYQENAGLSAARNTGIRASRGPLVGVLDADDMYEPEYMTTLVSALSEDREADGIYCGYQFVDHKNDLLPQIEARPVAPERLYPALLDGDFFVPESIFLRRRVYDDVGLFDEALRACEDWDVWLRAAKKYRIIHSSKILTRHRILPGSMSTDPLRMLDNRLAVLKKHVGEEPAGSGASSVHRAYGRAYLGSCVEYLQYRNEDHAFECFQKMAKICPGLLAEIDTFYQLGCGDQPKGWMGDLKSLNVKRNSVPLLVMMQSLFGDPGISQGLWRLRRTAYAQAYFALGILGYNTREFGEARRFLWRAMWSDTRLLLNSQVVGLWTKSWLGPRAVDLLKNVHQRIAPS
jgi:glycosyltransferase involved in cell wall biosynthesis